MNCNKIALLGMMGAGKSTIAKELSQKTNITFFELDEIFEKENNTTIKIFFKEKGESLFRIKESEILSKISKQNSFILSCGGGVILKEENRNILFKRDITTIYLKASVDEIFKRIKNNSTRPLLLVDNPKEEIEKILSQRQKYYKLANYTINTDNKKIDEIVGEIIKKYGKNRN